MSGSSTRSILKMEDEIDLSTPRQPMDHDSDDDSDKSSYISLGAPSVHEGDIERREEFGGWYLIGLAYKATGVIYGDIGTSPLYVYSSTFTSNPSYEDLLGVLSIIIWTLTLLVTVKYVIFVLYADDQGGGGVLALYSLLRRYARIDASTRPEHDERFPNTDMRTSNRYIRRLLEESPTAHVILQFVSILGFCLMVADGVLTPAQSVLGSIQGLNVWWPSMDISSVVIITCVILAIIFLVQFMGTGRLAHFFAPVIIVWFLLNIAFGIYNLIHNDTSVLKAFSPYFAGNYFVRGGTTAWKSLGGVLLAFTGVEAMYANLGAFSKRAIRISWLCLGYPSLLLAYIGQAAYISNNPSAYSNPFFNSVPPGTYWPALIISILATIVASQALITGTFQLISQAMKLSCFPEIKFRHTSGRIRGQIYIPLANWLLGLGTILVVIVYHDTTRLGRAYGTCVAMIVFITTCLVSLIAIIVWRIHPLVVFPIFLVFACLDSLYLSSALTKIPDGAWFTLLIALLLTFLVYIWRYGKESQHDDLVDRNSRPRWADPRLLVIQGVGIFVEKAGERSDRLMTRFRRKFNARHEVTVIFHLIPIPKPKVSPEDEYRVDRVPYQPNTYRVVIRRGFDDVGFGPDLGALIHDRLHNHICGRISRGLFNRTPDMFQESDLATLETAFTTQITYIIGKQHYKIRPDTKRSRRLALEVYSWLQGLAGSEFSEIENHVEGDICEIRILQDI